MMDTTLNSFIIASYAAKMIADEICRIEDILQEECDEITRITPLVQYLDDQTTELRELGSLQLRCSELYRSISERKRP